MNYADLKQTVEDYTENSFSAFDFAKMTKLIEDVVFDSSCWSPIDLHALLTRVPPEQLVWAWGR